MRLVNAPPLVSVVLAVNKIDGYLFSAINSILAQRDICFELVVVANGLQCNYIYNALYESYKSFDNVILVKTPVPQLAYALNLGISESRAEIIARMDADDVSFPERLVTQYTYMLKNNLDLVGSDVLIIDELGHEQCKRIYPRAKSINKILPFKNCFCHPSVMYKKELLYKARGYNAGFNSEDYDLWLRLMRVGVNWDNIPQPLLMYRVHQSSAQGTRLAYAECLALVVREFFLHKSLRWFIAILSHASKFLYKKMR